MRNTQRKHKQQVNSKKGKKGGSKGEMGREGILVELLDNNISLKSNFDCTKEIHQRGRLLRD